MTERIEKAIERVRLARVEFRKRDGDTDCANARATEAAEALDRARGEAWDADQALKEAVYAEVDE